MTAPSSETPRGRGRRKGTGIYVVAPLQPALSERILEIQRQFDPKLARMMPPHLTIIGSSGAGPIAAATPVEALWSALEPIAAATAPMTLVLGPPVRFMQTEIIVLPLDPHGPLRMLHERIRASGLPYAPPRFAFTPHVTLNFYRTLTGVERRELLKFRATEPARIDYLECSLTLDPQPAERLLILPLTGRP